MAAVAPHARAETPAVSEPRVRPRPRREPRPRIARGVVWIVVIGVLLAGVVFMNVAELRLNIRLDKLGSERTQLRSDIAELASKVSSAQAAGRIQAQARRDLGVIPASAAETTFLDLPAK